MADPASVALGLALVVLGATGATVSARRTEERGGAWALPLHLVPFGVLVGAGASLVRGWDLAASALTGAVLVPLVGVGGRWLESRRRGRPDTDRRRRRRRLHPPERG